VKPAVLIKGWVLRICSLPEPPMLPSLHDRGLTARGLGSPGDLQYVEYRGSPSELKTDITTYLGVSA
jgi:hypothetical protein